MKRSINWHKECLKNSTDYAHSKRKVLESDMRALERLENLNRLRKAQIDLAEKEGKDGFDEEKYAIKNLCV